MSKKEQKRYHKKYTFRSIIPAGSCQNCGHCTQVYRRCIKCHHPLCKACFETSGEVCEWCRKVVV